MLFNSVVFLYYFLPLVVIIYYFLPKRFRNSFLALGSLVFFAWGGVKYVILLLVSTLINYVFGLLADGNRKNGKLWLVLGIAANLIILVYYKYSGFFVENYNVAAEQLGWGMLEFTQVLLPIGISFYTFHGMSYQIDVYRDQSKAQRNFMNLLLYKTFFPQLIAGPIVRYNHIAEQLKKREFKRSNLEQGLQRFIIGLGKKVIVANTFAHVADQLWALDMGRMSTGTAWIALVCYAFQIYTDFSAYSDMAIGLARMFGFNFPENFNFPYLSKSFKEFWGRWHISLSTWFRDYLYIPLGGNRKGFARTFMNLWIVFLFTGFWHGASWNFVLWGALHGFFLSLEKIRIAPKLKIHAAIRQATTFFLVVLTWVPFRANDFDHTIGMYKKLFGLAAPPVDKYYQYLHANVLTRDLFIVALISMFLSFGGVRWLKSINWKKLSPKGTFTLELSKNISLILLFLLCTSYIVAGSYSPFIYFRF
jgi:alginate O-acetyltransferase complex protein AlgI